MRYRVVGVVLLLFCMFASNVFAYTFSNDANKIIAAILQGQYNDALDKCYALAYESKGRVKGEVLYLQGTCLMQRGNYKQARDTFKEALSFLEGDLLIEAYIQYALLRPDHFNSFVERIEEINQGLTYATDFIFKDRLTGSVKLIYYIGRVRE